MTPEELRTVLDHLDELDGATIYSVGGETWIEGAEDVPERIAKLMADPDAFVDALRRRAAVQRLTHEAGEENDDRSTES